MWDEDQEDHGGQGGAFLPEVPGKLIRISARLSDLKSCYTKLITRISETSGLQPLRKLFP